jgi:hypothetical protein
MTNSLTSTETAGIKSLREKLHIRTKIFLSLYVLLNSIAIFFHIFTSSYYFYRITESLSAQTDDRWCAPTVQGVGNHCFSDFFSVLGWVNFTHPWTTDPKLAQPYPNPLPPFVAFIFRPFAHLVQSNKTSMLPLMLYLGILVAAVLLPIVHLYYTKKVSLFVAILMAAMTLNVAPLLAGIDRGNILLLCVPFLYFFYVGILDSRFRLVLVVGVLLVLLKPQMILLGFIFLARRQWRMGMEWLGATIGGSFAAFILYPHGVFQNIVDFYHQASRYQNYVRQGDIFPINVSFSNTIAIFWRFISTHPFSSALVPLISVILCLAACVSLLALGKYRSTFHNLLIVTALPILVPGVSFNYYLVLLLVPLLFIVSDYFASGRVTEEEGGSPSNFARSSTRLFRSRLIGTLFATTNVLLLIPWALPWSLFVTTLQGAPPPLTSVNWAIGQFVFVILFVLLLFSVD